jgi:hypothetical protein
MSVFTIFVVHVDCHSFSTNTIIIYFLKLLNIDVEFLTLLCICHNLLTACFSSNRITSNMHYINCNLSLVDKYFNANIVFSLLMIRDDPKMTMIG